MIIENHKLKNFVQQDVEEVKKNLVALQYLRPVMTKNKIEDLTLEDVEFIKMNLFSNNDEDLIEIISKVQGIKHSEVFELKILDFFALVASVKKQLENIHKAETQLVPSQTNLKWELVSGSEKMAKFGIYNTLKHLSNGDRTKYDYFLKMKYKKVFLLLLMDKEESDLKNAMDKIKIASDV